MGEFNDDGSSKKKIAIIGVSSLILVAMVVAVAVGVGGNPDHGSKASTNSGSTGEISSSKKMIRTLCQPTDYKRTCEDSLNAAHPNTTDPKELIKLGFEIAIKSIKEALKNSSTLKSAAKDPRAKQALASCRVLMEDSVAELRKSIDQIGEFELSRMQEYVEDIKIWLSGSYTYQQTCLDAFEDTEGDAGEKMQKLLKTSLRLTSNALSMVDGLSSVIQGFNISSFQRRLLSEDGSPSWMGDGQRRLLTANINMLTPDVIVAKDGSGKYTTINQALNDIPKKNLKTFVIYVKAGIYKEYVTFTKSMSNVVLVGQGGDKTIITGNKGFTDPLGTFQTSTVVVQGMNFVAKDIGFENSGGAKKLQAVAIRVAADKAIFFNCHFYGYQDTLYVHTFRQFYRDCTVYGTIDFIFGNSATVMQNCKFIIRKPLETQFIAVTAHGRMQRKDPTGLVIQNSVISGAPEYIPVMNKNKAYLGRPWKFYSRTLIINSQIDRVIQPEGWAPWKGTEGLNTCFYAEVGNKGPGAALAGRAKWKGIKKLTPAMAAKYTAGAFIGGDMWIKPTGVPYKSGL
ncbi:hypothetical protein ACFE04_006076 [Oxalis oulophora]